MADKRPADKKPKGSGNPNRINRLMLREAERVAQGASCGALMIFGDTFVGGIESDPTD